MPNWVRLGKIDEIPSGRCRVYEASERTIAVFNLPEGVHAIDNVCVHRGGPLGEGDLSGKIVTCPWHHWSYDVTTGKTTMSETIGVKKYPLELRDDEVWVDVE